MIRTIVLAFLSGLWAANGIPHFVQGISAREYPNLTGNSPTNNAVGGLVAFVIAGGLIAWAHTGERPWAALVAGGAGVLVMTVFHAQRGAYRLSARFGKPLPRT
jgi:hypothetical protein